MNDRDTGRSGLVAKVPKIGLALGGGGARGLAHILVLEVFDELGIRPHLIAGTSIGALFGSVYASGMPGFRIRAMAEETLGRRLDLARQLFAARSDPVQKVLRLLPLRSSLLNPETLIDLLIPELSNLSFSDLAIPVKVIATDLPMHETIVLDEGPLKPAVAASIAIPLIFSPVKHQGRLLVDGGLVNPLPYEVAAEDADITVAIDVSGASREAEFNGRLTAVEVLMQSVQIMQKSITRQKMLHVQPDIYVDVDLDRFGALEFWRAKEILAAAEPVKVSLRRQLRRLLESETVTPLSESEASNSPPPLPPRRTRRLGRE
ncbi:MAG: patatin-like phospholipase family protein [Hyphomicrobiaceae bacterium]